MSMTTFTERMLLEWVGLCLGRLFLPRPVEMSCRGCNAAVRDLSRIRVDNSYRPSYGCDLLV